MSTTEHARKVAQLGAQLDSAVADGREWDELEPAIRELATAFADDLAATMLQAAHELRPRSSNAVVRFAEDFVEQKARDLGKTVRAALRPSLEVDLFHQIAAEDLVPDVVRARVIEVFSAASSVAGSA